MQNATQRLLDLVRSSCEPSTDYQVAKFMDVSRATVSIWHSGKGHMSNANVSTACTIAQIDEQRWLWHVRIAAEREKGPDGDIYRQALVDIERMAVGNRPSSDGPFAWLLRGGKHAAIILIAAGFCILSVFSPEKSALAATLERSSIDGPRYTLCAPSFGCCRSLLGLFPGFCGLPDLTGHRHSVGCFNGSSPSW